MRMIMTCALFLAAAARMHAGSALELKSITDGDFEGESLTETVALDDGESYAQISDDKKRIEKRSFKTGQQTATLFDANTVNGATIDEVEGYIIGPECKTILIQTETNKIYRRSAAATYYIYDVANNRAVPLSDGGQQRAPLFSPDGNVIAFARDGNIFLVKLLYGNAESQVTTDGKRDSIINGVPDWVYEEEFGVVRSMVFTADSKQLCYVKYDETDVKSFPVTTYDDIADDPDAEERVPGSGSGYPLTKTYKYPVAGETNSTVGVYSYDIKSRQTRKIDLPLDDDGYIPRIAVTGDPTKIVVFTMNRHQDNLQIYTANPLSTVCKLVVQEKVDKYMKEENVTGTLVTNNRIALLSEREGYNSIYVYSLTGTLQRTIKDGYDVTELYGIDETTGDVYFAAATPGPLDRQVIVSRRNGKTQTLSPQNGMNSAVFSKNLKYFICTHSDLNTPPSYTLYNNAGKALATLLDNTALTAKLAGYDLGTRELFTFTTPDGTELNGWMVRPAGFNASNKYPVIMYQYGGPGSQQVMNSWDIGMAGQGAILEMYMAQKGYIVVCVDNRGTGGRGADFEKCTYGQLGVLEASDQVEAALWLAGQPYVDKDRIGIWGWSYGGWNTLMSMSEGRPVFRAGVAIAPPTSWKFYDTIYTERYMRTPKENPAGYAQSPISRADKLHGALLLCHGLADDNVHFINTAEYAEALIQADKDFKMNVYPNKRHSIKGGNTRNHLFRQAINFFDTEMK